MDCDDVMLLLAKPDFASASLDDHLARCDECRDLSRGLSEGFGESTFEPPTDELLGVKVGTYQISELLGSGGMGRVYLAHHPEIGSRVAVKVFSKDWDTHPKLVSRFFAEARATNAIAHENIVNVLDVGRLEDGRPFMLMEHLPGRPLSELIGTKALTDSAVKQLALGVLSALSAAHANDIVHRDLKPDNIFVSPEGRATLLDFGVAKLMPEFKGSLARTATGTVLGTPHYMSPEQAVGDPVDERTDVYAMGVILYECFTGRRPFDGASLYRLLDQHINRDPHPPRSYRPDLGADIDALVMKALAKSPKDRYATVREMRAALAACSTDASSGAFLALDDIDEAAHSREAETEKPVADSPRGAPSREANEKKSLSRPLLWSVVALVCIALGLLLFAGTGSDSTLMPAALGSPDAGPAVDALPTRARRLPDAAPPSPDASAPSVGRAVPTKPRGVAPLSFLKEATRLAANNANDAVLLRVYIGGMSERGRVNRRSPASHIRFDFLSPTLVSRFSKKKLAECIVRVAYRGKSPAEVTRVSGRCQSLRPLSAPRCSLASLLSRGRSSGRLPKTGAPATAMMQVSKGGTHFWKFQFAGVNYKLPPC